MCIACTEFIKGTLKLNEFQRALTETTRENAEHLSEVTQILGDGLSSGKTQNSTQEQEKALREKLRRRLG